MTLNIEKNVCEPNKNNTNGGSGKGENEVDYMLWIFLAIIGVLLIIIVICIVKKICFHKDELESIDDIDGELVEK